MHCRGTRKIDMARLLTLKAAWLMDVAGNNAAKNEIAMIKVVAPSMACQVIDWAMQVHGGGGMYDDSPLTYAYAHARTLRFVDGPDEVRRNAIAQLELGKYAVNPKPVEMPITRGCRQTRCAGRIGTGTGRCCPPVRWPGPTTLRRGPQTSTRPAPRVR